MYPTKNPTVEEVVVVPGGNCCTIPYSAYNSYDRIMLRFRPIAPKPAPSATAGSSSSARSSPDINKGSRERHIGGRRRYVQNNTTTNGKKKIARFLSLTPEEEIKGTKATTTMSDKVTLPLLPPPYDHKGNHGSRVVCGAVTDTNEVNFMLSGAGNYDLAPARTTKLPLSIIDTCDGSWVQGGDSEWGIRAFAVVECVTDAWVDGNGKGLKVRSLQDDTCPCFISDGAGRARWWNEAFRRMVAKTDGDKGGVEGVWLVMREEAAAMTVGRSFGCRVRMVCTWQGMKISSMTSPCDGWRMDGGDFAWRLDVGAALRLGR